MSESKQLGKISRDELYELVWSKPVSKILIDYPFTPSKFKKICNDYKIPLPPNGYWQKLRHNKKVFKTPLPEIENKSEKISLSKEVEAISELNMLIREIKKDEKLPLVVSDNFTLSLIHI